MQGTMKQLIFVTKGELELREVEIPQIDDNGLLVKIAYCGICGSDLHAYTKGGMYGGVADGSKFGHEFVGTVVEVGANITDFKIGDHVWARGDACTGNPRTSTMAGGFAEYIAVKNVVKNETTFLVPNNIPMRRASLIEPFTVGVHTKNRGGAKPGMNILMLGAGPIGLMGWAAMKHQGIDTVLVAAHRQARIDFAKRFGCTVFDNEKSDTYEYAGEHFGIVDINTYERPNIDLVIDMVGAGYLMGEYLEKGRPNSVFSTLGLDGTPLTIKPSEFMSKQFTVTGARGRDPEDVLEVIEVLQDESLDLDSLITGEYTLEQYDEAFTAARNRDTGMKVIFRIAGDE